MFLDWVLRQVTQWLVKVLTMMMMMMMMMMSTKSYCRPSTFNNVIHGRKAKAFPRYTEMTIDMYMTLRTQP